MGRWNNRWAPRRRFNSRRYKDYDYEEPPPSPPSPHHPQANPPLYQEGSEVPWEVDFCKSVHVPWHKVTTAKKFMYLYESVLAWDDSAGEEAFQNAKQRYWEKISGLPTETPLPDPDMYLDKLDWNPKIDSRLMADIDGIYFNPDEMGRSRKFDTRAENVPNQDLGFGSDDGNNNNWEEGSSAKIIGLNGLPDNLENENNPWEQNSPALVEAANNSAWTRNTDHEPIDNRQWTAGGWKQDGSASNWKQDGSPSGWKQDGSASGWKQDGSDRGGWKHDGSASNWNQNGLASGWKQDGSARGGWKQDGLARGGWKHDGSASGWKQDGSARGGWKHDGSARGGWKHDGSSRGGWNQDGSTRGGWKPEGSTRGGWKQDDSTRGGWKQDDSTRGGWKQDDATRGGWKQDDATRGGWKQDDSTRGGWKQEDSTRGGWDQDGLTNGWKQDALTQGWKQDASSRGWKPRDTSRHCQQNSEDKVHTWHNSFGSNTKAPGNKTWDGQQLTNNFKRSNESERADQSGYRKREGSFSNSQRYKTSRLEVNDNGGAYRWQEKPHSSDRFNA